MNRVIVKIDEEKCNGCGACIIGCHEGALQLVNGKAKLVKESYCDGLGACLPACPMDAISLEERESQPFDETAVQEHIAAAAPQAVHACPSMSFAKKSAQWPIQLHLQTPENPCFVGADLVLAADCVAFQCKDFQRRFLQGKALSIACPKLDGGQERYVETLRQMIDVSKINSITIMRMEVPCCGGLVRLAQLALMQSTRKIPLYVTTVGIDGAILEDTQIQ